MRRSPVLALAAAAAVLFPTAPVATAGPLVPPWPAAGLLPLCGSVVPGSADPTGFTWTYTDTGVPRVMSRAAPRIIELGPTTHGSLTITARVTNPCSGSVAATLFFGTPTGFASPADMSPTTANAFDQTYRYTVGPLTPTTAPSLVTCYSVLAYSRYGSFVLDQDGRLLNVVKVLGGGSPAAGAYSGPAVRTWVLRGSRLTSTVSRTTVARGGTVVVTGKLSGWTGTHYLPRHGVPVMLQRRVGTGPWRTLLTRNTTGGLGSVVFPVTVTAAASYRLAYGGSLPSYDGGAVSPARRVNVG
jgi:hypothetical protein